MRYPLTFYVDSLPPGVGGCANGPVIRILKKYRNDEGIYRHELVHVKQWFFTLSLHSLLYLIIPEYRLWSEVEAYKEQLKYYPDNRVHLFAKFIATNYGLIVTQEYALKLLRR